MNAAKVFIAKIKSFWPGGNVTPVVGKMKGSDLSKPNKNINNMAEATALASLVTIAMGSDVALPIAMANVIVTGEGTDEIVAVIL